MGNYCENCPHCSQHDTRITQNRKDIDMIEKEIKKHNWWSTTLTFIGVVITASASTLGVIVGFYGKSQGWW